MFLEGFCHSCDVLVDVVDHASLALQFPVQGWVDGTGLVELIAELGVGLLKALPVPVRVAAHVADGEAERCGQQHPYR